MDFLHRTRLLYGDTALENFQSAVVAVFGLGGVGGHAMEALARCGIGTIIVVDRDVVDITNINRQAVATIETVGKPKVDVAETIIKSINPNVNVIKYNHSFSDDYDAVFEKYGVDYVCDCIDDVTAKLNLICYCKSHDINIISSMGTALRKHPELLEITDVYKTSYDPLARVMRHELKKRGVKELTVVCSKEEPAQKKDNTLGSSPFVPSVSGLIMASYVANIIAGKN